MTSEIKDGDCLYRCVSAGTYPETRTIETLMLRSGIKTFYRDLDIALQRNPNSFVMHQKYGVPIPTTITPVSAKDISSESVKALGGFPIILKVTGGSKGIGVMKLDTMEALTSVTDYLLANQTQFILREFVELPKPVYSLRAVVMGNKVAVCYKNQSVSTTEFRSNVDQSQRSRTLFSITPDQEQTLVRAVESLGLELGAVDFVLNEKGDIRIFEVNFPFNFMPVIVDLNIPIHQLIVSYLKDKQIS
jgi:ribosomal protein S6--L-glutamate ligase